MFIGDMDLDDARLLRTFMDEMLRHDIQIHCVILPSFGGVTAHGSTNPTEVPKVISKVACLLRGEYGLLVAATPHPVRAEWADYNAVRL